MERPSEYIAAEKALTEACERAIENAIPLRLIYDDYGVMEEDGVYVAGEGCACAIGAFLVGKDAYHSNIILDAKCFLGVSSYWLWGVDEGFTSRACDASDSCLTENEPTRDGWETGLRLADRFRPQRLHDVV